MRLSLISRDTISRDCVSYQITCAKALTETGAKRIVGLSAAAWAAIWFVSIGIPAGIVAYYRMVAGFSWWDDEGTLMMSVKQLPAEPSSIKKFFQVMGRCTTSLAG